MLIGLKKRKKKENTAHPPTRLSWCTRGIFQALSGEPNTVWMHITLFCWMSFTLVPGFVFVILKHLCLRAQLPSSWFTHGSCLFSLHFPGAISPRISICTRSITPAHAWAQRPWPPGPGAPDALRPRSWRCVVSQGPGTSLSLLRPMSAGPRGPAVETTWQPEHPNHWMILESHPETTALTSLGQVE